jgi:hypothetical protein
MGDGSNQKSQFLCLFSENAVLVAWNCVYFHLHACCVTTFLGVADCVLPSLGLSGVGGGTTGLDGIDVDSAMWKVAT